MPPNIIFLFKPSLFCIAHSRDCSTPTKTGPSWTTADSGKKGLQHWHWWYPWCHGWYAWWLGPLRPWYQTRWENQGNQGSCKYCSASRLSPDGCFFKLLHKSDMLAFQTVGLITESDASFTNYTELHQHAHKAFQKSQGRPNKRECSHLIHSFSKFQCCGKDSLHQANTDPVDSSCDEWPPLPSPS